MIKYAKLLNKETGRCEVGLGTNSQFYKSIGMSEMEVEQSDLNNEWYLSEKCPKKSDEQKHKEAIASKLADINEAKEKAFKEGIIFKGAHFDCDDRAQDRTGNRLLLLQAMPVETLEWLDYDYKPVEMSASDFQALCAAIFERVQFIEFKTGQLLNGVSEAASLEELDNLDINFSA